MLTIPNKPTDFDNGLLQASEIAQLKLNADWVVLSACNTAAEEYPGAEALWGLAQAFFYAGGRSLIVSNWQVDDESTAKLMLNTFQASTSSAKLSMPRLCVRQCSKRLTMRKPIQRPIHACGRRS